jgi:hypothetical protein
VKQEVFVNMSMNLTWLEDIFIATEIKYIIMSLVIYMNERQAEDGEI